MAEDSEPGLGTDVLGAASAGKLRVWMDPEQFARIEYECNSFKRVIEEISAEMRSISEIAVWGFGDDSYDLTSAPVMAARFRGKAAGHETGDDFVSVLAEHLSVVEEIRTLHALARERYLAQDAELAARFRAELARLDQLSAVEFAVPAWWAR
ncbi:hypothetical protein ACFVMC_30215 [Nocardia sp. NPDC127579]|uniref:hypothetical protein n=1 Tax=Nocardia sp. NPDC127579 TaxID=3345402 RepID=UPI00363F8942